MSALTNNVDSGRSIERKRRDGRNDKCWRESRLGGGAALDVERTSSPNLDDGVALSRNEVRVSPKRFPRSSQNLRHSAALGGSSMTSPSCVKGLDICARNRTMFPTCPVRWSCVSAGKTLLVDFVLGREHAAIGMGLDRIRFSQQIELEAFQARQVSDPSADIGGQCSGRKESQSFQAVLSLHHFGSTSNIRKKSRQCRKPIPTYAQMNHESLELRRQKEGRAVKVLGSGDSPSELLKVRENICAWPELFEDRENGGGNIVRNFVSPSVGGVAYGFFPLLNKAVGNNPRSGINESNVISSVQRRVKPSMASLSQL
ncbi:hypothetical protein MIND_00511700 [Mycena indigotica]|uniref:Uncharacterized protein n=1 Tax=Mycena indigotica TaxID=2126181 RepID=A0A8H6SYW3_9AGAR|nr:uncharacterized protein MIND_00511700 [Mycena indigotica]KAF7307181.1 hypothetical protein MIND_00511700 [Mycena indigotica]